MIVLWESEVINRGFIPIYLILALGKVSKISYDYLVIADIIHFIDILYKYGGLLNNCIRRFEYEYQ